MHCGNRAYSLDLLAFLVLWRCEWGVLKFHACMGSIGFLKIGGEVVSEGGISNLFRLWCCPDLHRLKLRSGG